MLVFGFICFAAATAQSLSVGVIGGGALTNAFKTINAGVPGTVNTYSQAKDYLAGASLEYHLPANFSLEVDGIFRELHLTLAFIEANGTPNSVSPAPVVTWEFPVLGKYRFRRSGTSPFIEAGPSFRTTGNLNANPSHTGAAAGVGVELGWKGFEIAPVLRYTRWVRDPHELYAESKSDQLEMMVGISRRPRLASHPLGSRVLLGVIAGTSLTPDYPTFSYPYSFIDVQTQPMAASGTVYQSGARSFIVGPVVEIALAKRLFLEADALYHPLPESIRYLATTGAQPGSYSAGVSDWEIPVLAKYKFGTRRFRPAAEAGPAFRLPGDHLSAVGVSAGVSVEARVWSLRISPGVRYTHWDASSPAAVNGVERNQLMFLTAFAL